MILTVTMNPSVDMSYALPTFAMDQVNRCQNVRKTAGGKGLNVTRVIHRMGEPVKATGLLGGVLGTFIKEELNQNDITHAFSPIKGDTRNCIAVLHDGGKQTEILEAGPTVSQEELIRFENLLLEEAQQVDVITISGSLPKGAPVNFYADLLEKVEKLPVKVILDTSGESLEACLKSSVKPYGIKPNLEELSSLLNQEVTLEEEDLKQVLSQELFCGIPLILVSLGKDGAFAKYQEAFYRVSIPKVAVLNPVGSGDSTVAGLGIAIKKGLAIEETLKTAMALGILNAMESQTGYVNPDKFDEIFKQIDVTIVD
ncbi:MAG: hexose kinase [Vagococcus sp.]